MITLEEAKSLSMTKSEMIRFIVDTVSEGLSGYCRLVKFTKDSELVADLNNCRIKDNLAEPSATIRLEVDGNFYRRGIEDDGSILSKDYVEYLIKL